MNRNRSSVENSSVHQFEVIIFPESDERRVLVVYVFSRGRDVRPGRIRYASDSHPTYRFLSNCCRIAIEGRIRSIDFWGLATWADF